MPFRLPTSISPLAASRTWATEPGALDELGGVQRLDRVDDADVGPLGLDRRDDRAEVGLGERRDVEGAVAEPLGAHPHLGGRLLAGHVEDRRDRPRRGCRAPSR